VTIDCSNPSDARNDTQLILPIDSGTRIRRVSTSRQTMGMMRLLWVTAYSISCVHTDEGSTESGLTTNTNASAPSIAA